MPPERRIVSSTSVKDLKTKTEEHQPEKEETAATKKFGHADSSHYGRGVAGLCFRRRRTLNHTNPVVLVKSRSR